MDTKITLSSKAFFSLFNAYPNPDDDNPGGPFGPIMHIAHELMRVIAHRPISDPHWGARPATMMWVGPDPTFWTFGNPDSHSLSVIDLRTPWIAWLATLIARDYTSQISELANLAEQLPEFKDSLLERASALSNVAIDDCGTMTPSQRLQELLKKKGIKFPPKGWPTNPGAFGSIVMANELYQTSLLIANETLSAQLGNAANKLLETGLSQLG